VPTKLNRTCTSSRSFLYCSSWSLSPTLTRPSSIPYSIYSSCSSTYLLVGLVSRLDDDFPLSTRSILPTPPTYLERFPNCFASRLQPTLSAIDHSHYFSQEKLVRQSETVPGNDITSSRPLAVYLSSHNRALRRTLRSLLTSLLYGCCRCNDLCAALAARFVLQFLSSLFKIPAWVLAAVRKLAQWIRSRRKEARL